MCIESLPTMQMHQSPGSQHHPLSIWELALNIWFLAEFLCSVVCCPNRCTHFDLIFDLQFILLIGPYKRRPLVGNIFASGVLIRGDAMRTLLTKRERHVFSLKLTFFEFWYLASLVCSLSFELIWWWIFLKNRPFSHSVQFETGVIKAGLEGASFIIFS